MSRGRDCDTAELPVMARDFPCPKVFRDNGPGQASTGMIRTFIRSVVALMMFVAFAHADAAQDRSAVADALGKLSSYAEGLARTASKSEDRAIRKKLAARATEVADDLGNLAQRTRKDVPYGTLGKDALAIERDAAALIEITDEAQDKNERKQLRAQATTLEQSVVAVRKVIEALARDDGKPSKPVAMRGDAFDQLVATIRKASFDDDKVAVVRHAAQSNWFTAAQVASVMGLLAFDDGKIDAAVAMWPRLTDPENSFVIFNKLAFESSKEKLRKRVAK